MQNMDTDFLYLNLHTCLSTTPRSIIVGLEPASSKNYRPGLCPYFIVAQP